MERKKASLDIFFDKAKKMKKDENKWNIYEARAILFHEWNTRMVNVTIIQ